MKTHPNDPRDPQDPNAPTTRPPPLRQWLEPAIDEPRISRAWQRIRTAQAAPQAMARRRSWRWLAAPVGGFVAAAAALWLLWLRPASSGEALRAIDEKVSLSAGAEVGYAADVIALRDGSRMILERDAQLQVLENDGERFVASLRRGTARLAVQAGPRRWTIETELATIEVIGAIVTIAHHEHMVTVSVERGVVMVRGERVPGRVARLIDGQGLSVVAEEAAATPAAPATPSNVAPATPSNVAPATPSHIAPATPSNVAAPATSPATAPAQPAPSRSSIVGSRRAIKPATAPAKPRTLLDAAPASPSPSATPAPAAASTAVPPLAAASEPSAVTSTAKALRDADQRRRSGDAQAAASLLEDARRQRPDDPAGGMVEYSLGRLYLNHLGQPGRAARVFSAVIDRGSPQPLIEGAMALRCEALWRAGERAAARAALDEYRRRYPNGSRLAGLTTLLSSEP